MKTYQLLATLLRRDDERAWRPIVHRLGYCAAAMSGDTMVLTDHRKIVRVWPDLATGYKTDGDMDLIEKLEAKHEM